MRAKTGKKPQAVAGVGRIEDEVGDRKYKLSGGFRNLQHQEWGE